MAKTGAFLPRSGTTRGPFPPLPGPRKGSGVGGRSRSTPIDKKEGNFTQVMRKTRGVYRSLREANKDVRRVSGTKSTHKKSVVFCIPAMSNWKLNFEILLATSQENRGKNLMEDVL